jgi:hypothetical protein
MLNNLSLPRTFTRSRYWKSIVFNVVVGCSDCVRDRVKRYRHIETRARWESVEFSSQKLNGL